MDFDWDDANREHLGRHKIFPSEAEHVMRNGPVQLSYEPHAQDETREKYVGVTASQRFLMLVITWREDRVRVITGWDASRSEKQMYLLERGQT